MKEATTGFAEWLIREWELDPQSPMDRRFAERVADAWNEVLIEVRDRRPPRWGVVGAAAWRAWDALQDERYYRGRVTADDTVDAFARALARMWPDFVRWRAASGSGR